MSFLLPHFLKARAAASSTCTSPASTTRSGPTPTAATWIEVLTDESQGRAARVPDADLERDRVVRRLRAADGPRRRASRSDEPGDARRALDRLPPAGAARGAGAARPDLRSHVAAHEANRWRGLGRRRVLDRAVVADRPGRQPRHPQVLRVALSPGREAHHRRVLPWIFENSVPGLPEAAAARGPRRRSSTCASTAPSPSRTTSTTCTSSRPRPGDNWRAPTVDPATHLVAQQGQAIGVEIDGKARASGFPTPSRKLEFFSQDAEGLGVARARGAGLHPQPRAPVQHRPRPRARLCCCRPSGCRR